MPMFYTPKPRQFKYRPRFYDPEKERWEALKQKYADERRLREQLAAAGPLPGADAGPEAAEAATGADDRDLAYFQRRVRELDGEERQRRRGLTWKDLFHKREMPTFNYRPRFQTGPAATGNGEDSAAARAEAALPRHSKRRVNISRKFDIGDTEYLKPVPAGRIMLYALLAVLLIYWIIN